MWARPRAKVTLKSSDARAAEETGHKPRRSWDFISDIRMTPACFEEPTYLLQRSLQLLQGEEMENES